MWCLIFFLFYYFSDLNMLFFLVRLIVRCCILVEVILFSGVCGSDWFLGKWWY